MLGLSLTFITVLLPSFYQYYLLYHGFSTIYHLQARGHFTTPGICEKLSQKIVSFKCCVNDLHMCHLNFINISLFGWIGPKQWINWIVSWPVTSIIQIHCCPCLKFPTMLVVSAVYRKTVIDIKNYLVTHSQWNTAL